MRKFLSILAAIFLSLPVFAEARNALLIANSNYTNISKLGTPINEARELKQTLVKLGFSVTTVENGSKEKMLSAIASFSEKLKKENGIGFFHYGGHAVQLNGKNWLIPVNADVPDALRVTCNCIELDTIMSYMYAETNIVVIDACRDSPLPQGGVRGAGEKRGLVMMVPRIQNSIVVFSAGDGETAQDGVFTPLLTKKLLEKKLLNEIIIDVRNEVLRLTNNAQYPETKDRLVSKVYLAGNASGGQNYVPQTSSASSDLKTADEYYNLGVVAFNEKNYTTAAEYYKKAILINEIHKEALNNLGYCYEKGFGVTQNYAKAEELYRKSANLGLVTAQNNLGDLYYFGKGVSQDFSEAKKWYLKAAEQGYAYGQYNVGWLFEHGHGVNKNINTALSYYQMAANQGHEEAKKRIAAINASNSNNTTAQNNEKWLFPLYGLELGKSTVSDLKKLGKKHEKYDWYIINGNSFFHYKNVFNSVVVWWDNGENTNLWPTEWRKTGSNPSYSYNEWISFLKSKRYSIKVIESPHTDSKYNWFSAEIEATCAYPINHKIKLMFMGKYNANANTRDTLNRFEIRSL
ncbi:MAG: SEL1-like repeat protein [Treponema sp.]|nr:SEL1-like repeat protein [Treponema sp.]